MLKIGHQYERYWDTEKGRVIDCTTCGFIHVDPIPSREELDHFYSRQYFNDIKPFDYNSVTSEFVSKKKSEILRHGGYKATFNRVNRLIISDSGERLKMLDIGCGNDLLVAYFKEQNWDVSVIEPSKDAAAYLRKFDLKVYEQLADDLEKLKLTDFSFVNIQFVLEHIADPRALITKVNQAMSKDAILRICVPNDFSVGQMVYKEYFDEQPRWVVQPDHINYFSFSSLKQLLSDCGFEEVYRTTNFPLEFLLLGGINYFADESMKAQVGPFVKNFNDAFIKTGNWGKLSKLYESLAQLEMGRSIFMIAVKRTSL